MMTKEIDGKVYVEVDYLNELLDKANLYYNPDANELTGLGSELPEVKSTIKIGEDLPEPGEIDMLDNWMNDDEINHYPLTPKEAYK